MVRKNKCEKRVKLIKYYYHILTTTSAENEPISPLDNMFPQHKIMTWLTPSTSLYLRLQNVLNITIFLMTVIFTWITLQLRLLIKTKLILGITWSCDELQHGLIFQGIRWS